VSFLILALRFYMYKWKFLIGTCQLILFSICLYYALNIFLKEKLVVMLFLHITM